MPDLLKASQALDAKMEGRDFISVNWPESVRFRKAVKAATEELRSAEQAQAEEAAPAPAPAATDAPAPDGATS